MPCLLPQHHRPSCYHCLPANPPVFVPRKEKFFKPMSDLFFFHCFWSSRAFQALTKFTVLDSAHHNPGIAPNPSLLTFWFSQHYGQVAFCSLISSRTFQSLGLGMLCFSLEISSLLYPSGSVPHFILGPLSENSFFWEASSDGASGIAPAHCSCCHCLVL